MKQRRLSEKEIQNFEAGDESQLRAYFTEMTGAQAGELFVQLLRSYRDAARVANAAWLVLDESERNGSPTQVSYQRLVEALKLYAPMNFLPLSTFTITPSRCSLACTTPSRASRLSRRPWPGSPSTPTDCATRGGPKERTDERSTRAEARHTPGRSRLLPVRREAACRQRQSPCCGAALLAPQREHRCGHCLVPAVLARTVSQ